MFKFEIINKKYGIDNVQWVTLHLLGGLRSFHQPRVRRINQQASPLIFNVTVWIWKLIAEVWIPRMLQKPEARLSTITKYFHSVCRFPFFISVFSRPYLKIEPSGVLSGLAHLYYGLNATDLGQGESEQGQIIGQTLNCLPQCGDLTEEFYSIIRHCLQKVSWPLQWRISMASLAKKEDYFWISMDATRSHACPDIPMSRASKRKMHLERLAFT